MNLPYLVPRLVRHFLPERLTRYLLLRSLIIKPGLETVDPAAAVHRYQSILAAHGKSLEGRRVLVFGYGGRFDIGIGLLQAGADHVVLCDKYALPDDKHNAGLVEKFNSFVHFEHGRPRPRLERMTLLDVDVRDFRPSSLNPPVDLVVSNSVYEHVADVEGTTWGLARMTDKHGLHIHFIDLRDHFFRFPFQMLSYSEGIWRRWLNPTSNHNRLRLWEYRQFFMTCFNEVEISILAKDEEGFIKARKHIRSEFMTGELDQDSVTLIQIFASEPRS